jgi:hypothetical protein
MFPFSHLWYLYKQSDWELGYPVGENKLYGDNTQICHPATSFYFYCKKVRVTSADDDQNDLTADRDK